MQSARSWALAVMGLGLTLTTGCCRWAEHWCHDERPQYYQQPNCCQPNPCASGAYTGGYIAPVACPPPQSVPYGTGGRP